MDLIAASTVVVVVVYVDVVVFFSGIFYVKLAEHTEKDRRRRKR